MFEKMIRRFKRDKKRTLKSGINDEIGKRKEEIEKDEADKQMNELLMNKIIQYRKDTKDMDYLRKEIEEAINSQPNGFNKSIEGLSEAFKK